MFNPYYCLFEYSASDNYTLQISTNSDVNPDHFRYFYFIGMGFNSDVNPDHFRYKPSNCYHFFFQGRVMGMAVFNDKFLDSFFISSFYKRILGAPMDMEDLASIEPDRYNSLIWMMNNKIKGVLFETFSVEQEKFGEKIVHELKPGGAEIEVTDKNKKEYLDLYVKWRLTFGTEEQMAQLLRGFHEVIPRDLLLMFDPKELEVFSSSSSQRFFFIMSSLGHEIVPAGGTGGAQH